MIAEKSLVLYKGRPALVNGKEDGKFIINLFEDNSSVKVREKDVDLLHPGPCSISDFSGTGAETDIRSAWELLAGTGGHSVSELAELLYGVFTPSAALAVWDILGEGLFFTGDIKNIQARSRPELEAEEKKRLEKQREIDERNAFTERLKKILSSKGEASVTESDLRFLQDVQALALGRTDRSRTLRELEISETPVDAHRFLLAIGAWSMWENPHPGRFGISMNPACSVSPPKDEERLDISELPAFAIDNSYSEDPDDAVSLSGPDPQGRFTLWVHTADPAASVTPGSPADREAQNRGATLYLPEGCSRMLAPEALRYFALGYEKNGAEKSAALSFKILINPDFSIADTQIFLTKVRVTRLTYKEADDHANSADSGVNGETLRRLFSLADNCMNRRLETGAILIELPDVHIQVDLTPGEKNGGNNRISIEKILQYRSMEMVRECMILAGEAAASWAVRNRVPFPFISQEAGDLPRVQLQGLAGAWKLRRSMRPRVLSTKPGVHWGLGLDLYSQVSSPLRRYTDLLAHQQIRAFLLNQPLLNEDDVLVRIGTAEAGALTTVKAERASRSHWTAVYLADKIGSSWEGVILDNSGGRAAVIIPDLGLEIQVNHGKGGPNDTVNLTCLGVKIPEGEAIFTM